MPSGGAARCGRGGILPMIVAWIGYGLGGVGWPLASVRRPLRRPAPWVSFLIEAPLPELPRPPGPRWQRLVGLGRPPLSLRELRGQVRRVARDPRARGVVIHLRPLDLSGALVEALREVIIEARRGGKQVICWAPSYTAST